MFEMDHQKLGISTKLWTDNIVNRSSKFFTSFFTDRARCFYEDINIMNCEVKILLNQALFSLLPTTTKIIL